MQNIYKKYNDFYPRPPWGGRLTILNGIVSTIGFLSTPSVGRATAVVVGAQVGFDISIHALRGEGDPSVFLTDIPSLSFLSTPSVGRATLAPVVNVPQYDTFLSTPSVGRATPAE